MHHHIIKHLSPLTGIALLCHPAANAAEGDDRLGPVDQTGYPGLWITADQA